MLPPRSATGEAPLPALSAQIEAAAAWSDGHPAIWTA
jgi:hypothetical protein